MLLSLEVSLFLCLRCVSDFLTSPFETVPLWSSPLHTSFFLAEFSWWAHPLEMAPFVTSLEKESTRLRPKFVNILRHQDTCTKKLGIMLTIVLIAQKIHKSWLKYSQEQPSAHWTFQFLYICKADSHVWSNCHTTFSEQLFMHQHQQVHVVCEHKQWE